MKSLPTMLILSFFFQFSTSFASNLPHLASRETLKELITKNKKLKNLDEQSLNDFCDRVIESGISYANLEARLSRSLKTGALPFQALEKAINNIKNHEWRSNQIKNINNNPDTISYDIKNLNLKDHEENIALTTYALCVVPWKEQSLRQQHFTPKICSPIDTYDHMRHYSDSVSLRTKASSKTNARTKAYKLLVLAAQEVISSENLNNLEILLMAKCFAENSIRFTSPAKHPTVACRESLKVSLRSPESAFFQKEGVCTNTSGIAYNMARALGFKGPLFLARHHLHVFLEAEVEGTWLHFHPLNYTKKSCDFVQFPVKDNTR